MDSAPVRWGRISAVSAAILIAVCIVVVWAQNFRNANSTDFLSFWAAGQLALQGEPSVAYDIVRHQQVEYSITRFQGVLPFPYPPPFLLIVTPFGLASYTFGFAAWVLLTAVIYALAARRVAPLPYALSHPAVLTNGLLGQNGFLVTGIFIAGASMLKQRPFLAGAILGTLVIKPHLALLLPVAVIASRQWPAIWGAALSSIGLLLLALVLLGWSSFEAFLAILPSYGEMMEQGTLPWHRLASPFAFARYFGVDQDVALAIHILIAAAAAALTWVAWARDWPEKVAILAAATLLISPYVHTYDCLLLIAPMGYCLVEQRRPWLFVILWALCAVTVSNVLQLYYGASTIPIAAIIALAALVEGRRGKAREAGRE